MRAASPRLTQLASGTRRLLLSTALMVAAGCAGRSPTPGPPAPADGRQVDSSASIDAVAQALAQVPHEQLPGAVAGYIVDRFRWDNGLNGQDIGLPASALFERGYLGGCDGYAVVATALLRAAGVRSRLVVSVQQDWVEARRTHPFRVPRGHVFLEVEIDGRWQLLDVPYLQSFHDYDPAKPTLPRGERFCRRADDFWEAGIASPIAMTALLKRCADQQASTPPPAARPLSATDLQAAFARSPGQSPSRSPSRSPGQ